MKVLGKLVFIVLLILLSQVLSSPWGHLRSNSKSNEKFVDVKEIYPNIKQAMLQIQPKPVEPLLYFTSNGVVDRYSIDDDVLNTVGSFETEFFDEWNEPLKLYVTEKFSAQKYEELREIYLLHLNEILPQRTKITFIYLSRVTFDNVCQFVTKNMLGHEINMDLVKRDCAYYAFHLAVTSEYNLFNSVPKTNDRMNTFKLFENNNKMAIFKPLRSHEMEVGEFFMDIPGDFKMKAFYRVLDNQKGKELKKCELPAPANIIRV